jgi:hypothetical protein
VGQSLVVLVWTGLASLLDHGSEQASHLGAHWASAMLALAGCEKPASAQRNKVGSNAEM